MTSTTQGRARCWECGQAWIGEDALACATDHHATTGHPVAGLSQTRLEIERTTPDDE